MDYSRFAHVFDQLVRFEDDLEFFAGECSRGAQTFTTTVSRAIESTIVVPVEFCLPPRAWFERAAVAAGFRIAALFGDYDRSAS